jgi:hypothetical protein
MHCFSRRVEKINDGRDLPEGENGVIGVVGHHSGGR